MKLADEFLSFQMAIFAGSLFTIFVLGMIVTLVIQYPFIGLERALLCQTKLQAVLSGRHPLEQVVRSMDDQYFGRYTSDWLGGDKRLTEKAREVPPDHLDEYVTQSQFVQKPAVIYENQAFESTMDSGDARSPSVEGEVDVKNTAF